MSSWKYRMLFIRRSKEIIWRCFLVVNWYSIELDHRLSLAISELFPRRMKEEWGERNGASSANDMSFVTKYLRGNSVASRFPGTGSLILLRWLDESRPCNLSEMSLWRCFSPFVGKIHSDFRAIISERSSHAGQPFGSQTYEKAFNFEWIEKFRVNRSINQIKLLFVQQYMFFTAWKPTFQ